MENINNNVKRLNIEDKEIILLGTAHVSKESADLVVSVINDEKPDTVCVELCQSRYQSIRQKEKWQETDIVKVIKDKKAFLLLSNLLLASFQKKIAKKLDIKPGEEMIKAVETGEAAGARIHLADRDITITLSRIWRIMGFWEKLKLLFQMVMSLGEVGDINEEDIEKMKQEDVLETLLSEVGKTHPVLKDILIDERDRYLAYKIKTAPGKKIVAVVGAGHVPGILNCWNTGRDTDIESLEKLPPQKRTAAFFKWMMPLGILVLFMFGFFYGGLDAGTDMIWWWFIANGVLAGLGALIAMAHPLTILSSIIAAPLTSLNPMIAAGWVSGLTEAFFRKPKVKDLERLPEDILSLKGFWKNRATRILLVVVFTNLGSAVGTMVAIPLMAKVL
ncbi:MAG: TraB/GumN family protein [Deltaproteobacteria bacterium]|nr:TraB/GumN family protein [Deltaproteobacteria bacterium]MBW2100177.1 TraB/GumN family protein [Deltaproteobacteria bacterium]